MIFLYLIVFIVALLLANVFVAVAMPKNEIYAQKEEKPALEPEVVQVINAIDERHAMTKGSLEATNRKLMVLNDRVNTMEKALADVISKKMEIEDVRQKEDVDVEKIDFRLKVLEQQVEALRHPKTHQEKPNTFYGKVDPELEREVKALAFNTKRN